MSTPAGEALLATVRKLEPHAKRLWVEALRSGDYEQTRAWLCEAIDGPQKHCCLGVLCEVAIKAGVPVTKQTRGWTYAYSGASVLPPSPVLEWAYSTLVGEAGILRIPHLRITDDGEEVLDIADFTALNDDFGYSFAQIADLIEEYL